MLPGSKTRVSPSPVVISILPDRMIPNCRFGAGCQSPTKPAGKRVNSVRVAAIDCDANTAGAGGAKSIGD